MGTNSDFDLSHVLCRELYNLNPILGLNMAGEESMLLILCHLANWKAWLGHSLKVLTSPLGTSFRWLFPQSLESLFGWWELAPLSGRQVWMVCCISKVGLARPCKPSHREEKGSGTAAEVFSELQNSLSICRLISSANSFHLLRGSAGKETSSSQ